ncbi:MAG: sigma-70 family RNA polymerase sigma factor [Bacteroidetes bacterium]|nr:sigma-70 family RNA polymerase sigma factor [Bacteroidota bacterium]
MFALCLRYAKHSAEAEDILQEGFIKVFDKISSFRGDGSFEGWIRRIMIHTAIKYYHKASRKNEAIGWESLPDNPLKPDVYGQLDADQILGLIQELPEGYRLVFNLHALEGYKHKEIADMLEIGESTSRSQLTKARSMLQNMIEKMFTLVL